MLLTSYGKEIVESRGEPQERILTCIVSLNEDVGEALPYVNAILGGLEYTRDPPSLRLKTAGKVIEIQSRTIFISNLDDEFQADRILEWLKKEINTAWKRRHHIKPRYEGLLQKNPG
ncbi:hypothetical protein [Desulfoferrobacter suflitae]|uniref:hypothetical protein n=1 Tax=Desulfoferrobacter suflitae TaxID=2865782 RepID=UPI0021642444|nr:hypothetical protein [Desulfoferrobacter suflitae]MCK8603671.1 hypothetical protein [Desulfoferrobacter suflitae]